MPVWGISSESLDRPKEAAAVDQWCGSGKACVDGPAASPSPQATAQSTGLRHSPPRPVRVTGWSSAAEGLGHGSVPPAQQPPQLDHFPPATLSAHGAPAPA